jgi:cysteine desulfurase/selenocysteine lyase
VSKIIAQNAATFSQDPILRKVREDFPILKKQVRGKRLVYLDNAATSQKPQMVIDRINRYYSDENSNINRGVHYLSEYVTQEYEASRSKIQRFLNASDPAEVVFVRGTTEAINLVAQSYGKSHVAAGDEILISAMEHHANIVPWQLLCEQIGCRLRVIPITDQGELILSEYENLFNPRTRLVAITHISNVLGTINPVKELIQIAHARNVPVLLDAAQSAPHLKIDVQDLDCDFLAFSGHKLFGPTGIGVLYGKLNLLERMPPYQGGGDMIATVSFEQTTYKPAPHKFEAGTPHVAGVIGLGTAIEYIEEIGLDRISQYEQDLLEYVTSELRKISGARIIGEATQKASILSFVLDQVHAHDIGTILDAEGIAIRVGHHCAMPLMARFEVPATARVSLAFYNTPDDIDVFIRALDRVKEIFA